MSLNDLRRGQTATIDNIDKEQLRIQLLRFGITPGCRISCHTNIPFGPVVLRYGKQEIALGQELARQINVTC